MNALKIALKINGEEKTFMNSFVTFALYRKSLEFMDKFASAEMTNVEALDLLADYVCMVFDNQFTIEELRNGLPVRGLQEKLWSYYNDIVSAANGEDDDTDATAETDEEGK